MPPHASETPIASVAKVAHVAQPGSVRANGSWLIALCSSEFRMAEDYVQHGTASSSQNASAPMQGRLSLAKPCAFGVDSAAMLRRRLCAPFVLVLATLFSPPTNAGPSATPPAATAEDDAADKEIERLFGEAKYDEALKLAEKLVKDREARLGKEHPRTASAISDLGALHLAKGRPADAEPFSRRAVEILEKAPGNEGLLATALSNLSSVYLAKGDVKGSTTALERAVTIQEKPGVATESERAAFLGKLGTLYMTLGKLREAEKLMLRALSMDEKLHADKATFLDLRRLGALYRANGRYAVAVDMFNRAIPLGEQLYGKKHLEMGRLYHIMAILLTGDVMADKNQDKQVAAADHYFQMASDILNEKLGADHPEVGQLYSDWAILFVGKLSTERALTLRIKAQDIEEKWLEHALASGTEEDKLSYALRLERSMDRAISFHTWSASARSKVPEFVVRTILRNKAQALEATAASTSALRERLTPENITRFDELVRIRGDLASRFTSGPRGQTVAEFQAEVDELSRKAAALDDEISKASAPYRRSARHVTVDDVAEKIPEDAALVEIVRYHFATPHFHDAKSERSSAPMYMVYALRHDGSIRREQVSLSATDIDGKVEKIRRGLQNPDDKRVFDELHLLYRNLLIRLLPQLPGVKHLIISPDGDLSLVPFGALITEEGKFLAEKYTITYVSSGRDLLRFDEREIKSSAPMLVANPDYDAPSESNQPPLAEAPKGSLPLLARVKFPPLPGTAEEAEGIRHIVPGPIVELQREATETAVKRVSGPKILHIATHGFFLDETGSAAKGKRGLELEVPAKSLPTVKDPPAEDSGAKVEVLNPMFLSGLALAGANVRKGQTDDGILTAYEASALDLSGTELVVLSACETGIGSRVAREGVRGLRRALVLAGAETQVMSLWQVDDEATRDLMTNYYQGMFQKGLGRGEAMRQAQSTIRAQPGRQHPFYWASFIVSGNWAPISGTNVANPKGLAIPPGGAKGCGCRVAGDNDGNPITIAMLSAAGLWSWRRSKRRNHTRPNRTIRPGV